VDEVLALLQAFADKLGTTVEDLGPHVVRHIQIRAVAKIAAACVALVAAFSLTGISLWSGFKHGWWTDSGDPKPTLVLAIIGSIALAIAFPICLVEMAHELPYALEPLGGAVRILLGR
jgi:hypothetical protein